MYFTSNPFPVNQDRAVLRPQGLAHLPFSAAYGFDTLSLAHVLDSLVRVSRRVVQDRYARCPLCGNETCNAGMGQRNSPGGSYTLDSTTTQQTSHLERIRILSDLQPYTERKLGLHPGTGVDTTNTTWRPAA